ncbi:hypothetical protein BO94DRAFT_470668 [Aspergillus sclerotioniger CBS 115572]|uniref:MOZ protein represents a chromatin-associated acetyltransferase n=1 Tax=Aspergillus sclerotioniger CBS 115572 TaxID=1450535 RepID=A0A317W4L6_9EURO|nr:hypothetical protein BO94DRAFT_470668 [Aspergillus sclerotioniger CBS 115572]PWY80949.1 hypothetical protein BO94DRAFT_470668 [Aspergillus sclerotioniger CBS 115572]
MAAPRLPFLYPNLMRAVRSCEPHTYRSLRLSSRNQHSPFHTSRRHAQETYHRRYGPAAEANLPPPSKPKDEASRQKTANPSSGKNKDSNAALSPSQAPPEQSEQTDTESIPSEASNSQPDKSTAPATEQSDEHEAAEEQESREDFEPAPDTRDAEEATAAPSERPPEEPIHLFHPLNQNPLDGVLHMPSPASYLTTTDGPTSGNKSPNLAPAPYVHHFDSYSLVRDLSTGGFSEEQSVTMMKAVRTILHSNLDLARQSLTSKSDVENESYLFKAACSELQSSLQTARTSEMQRQRASRTQLQHESDILSQRLNQELAGLKDDIKGMFNDHKMSTREQQRSIDTSVQELNYKITVSLNSDGKSEIEGLRWILTRRAAMAIATSAFMIIIFLKYYSVRKARESAEKKKKKQDLSGKVTKEARAAAQDPISRPKSKPVPEVLLGESLG